MNVTARVMCVCIGSRMGRIVCLVLQYSQGDSVRVKKDEMVSDLDGWNK